MIMTSELQGSINWRYTSLNGEKINARNRNGIKRATIFNLKNEIWINLFSDNDKRFGREVLKKEKVA